MKSPLNIFALKYTRNGIILSYMLMALLRPQEILKKKKIYDKPVKTVNPEDFGVYHIYIYIQFILMETLQDRSWLMKIQPFLILFDVESV